MLASSNIIHNRAVVSVMRLILSIIRTPAHARYGAYCHLSVVRPGARCGRFPSHCRVYLRLHRQVLARDRDRVTWARLKPWAMGSTKVRAFIKFYRYLVASSLPFNCLFCFEGNVRYASIRLCVGRAGGLGLILNEKIGWREYSVWYDPAGAVRDNIHHRKHQQPRRSTGLV